MTPQYSTNPQVQQTIEELLGIGCPPIPVAPKQLAPENTKITGKNPSYLNPWGAAVILQHGQFRDRLPTDEELRKFFVNQNTGVGTLGGHGGIVWLDFDRKCYPSQEACDADFKRVVEAICCHALCLRSDLWLEQTGSGGYRIAVIPQQPPTFTNFTTKPGGQHVGEALFKGRFTVLAPSIHPNGNYYKRLEWGTPVEIDSLEAIGIYPANVENKKKSKKKKKKSNVGDGGTFPTPLKDRTVSDDEQLFVSTIPVPLLLLLTLSDRSLISNGETEGSRNNSGIKLAINLVATANSASVLGIPTTGDPRQLFNDYCSHCVPALSAEEADLIWASAEKINGTPSLPVSILLKCAIAYQRRVSHQNTGEPDPEAYAKFLKWEQEQEENEEAASLAGFL